MATRRRAADTTNTPTPAPETPDTSSGGLKLAFRESTGVVRAAREKKDDEALREAVQAVQASLDMGRALATDVNTEDEAKKAVNLLRRAAQSVNVGLKVSTTQNGSVWTIDFHAVANKRKRQYTAKDIRDWYAATYATDAGPAELTGPIPSEVREAFKVANGYIKSTSDQLNNM